MFRNRVAARRFQRGFLVPVAIFLVIALVSLAATVSYTVNQTQSSFTQELLNVQAVFAAQSGAQRALQTLFYPDASTRLGVDSRCASLGQTYSFATVNGLNLCSAEVSCVCRYSDNTLCSTATASNYAPNTTLPVSFYTVSSVGSCGSGIFAVNRRVQVGGFMQQE